jgi:hypothetical protein
MKLIPRTIRALILPFLLIAAPSFATTTVTTPTNGAVVDLSVHYVATASSACKKGVASMGVYVDSKLILVQKGASFDGTITLTAGKHKTVVEEWDYCGGASYSTINVTAIAPAAVPTASITANPTSVLSGKSSQLTVAAKNATKVVVSGTDGSSFTLSSTGGTQVVAPTTTTTYTATATGTGGTASSSASVTVLIPAPTVTLTATNATISTGSPDTLATSATNATQVVITGTDGSKYTLPSGGGMQTVSPTATTIYTSTATGANGVSASVSYTVTVSSTAYTIPSNAVSSGYLDGSSKWEWNHDPGTSGSSTGTSIYPIASPSLDNLAREHKFSYTDHGGEIYHLSFGNDSAATHFVYDTHVYLVDPTQVENIEMDMNQVMANGKTLILGTQCAGYTKTWEYTLVNGGTHWVSSNIPCNPTTWTANTWHHIQIATHRDSDGTAHYDWVSVDGKYSSFANATGDASESLGWSPGDLLLNFQLDGANASGSATVYTDEFQIYRW